MARKRQVILMKRADADAPSFGSLAHTLAALAPFNTAPDGSGSQGLGETLGTGFLHGPGFVVELPTAQNDIPQLMLTLTDEDFAWSVLARICRHLQCRMLDPETGQSFG